MSRRYSVACTPGDSVVLTPQGWDQLNGLVEQGHPDDPAGELEEWSHWNCEPMQGGQWRCTRFYPEVKAK